MRSLSSSFRCEKRHTVRPDTLSWAHAFITAPARTPQEVRHQLIVAELLADLEGTRS